MLVLVLVSILVNFQTRILLLFHILLPGSERIHIQFVRPEFWTVIIESSKFIYISLGVIISLLRHHGTIMVEMQCGKSYQYCGLPNLILVQKKLYMTGYAFFKVGTVQGDFLEWSQIYILMPKELFWPWMHANVDLAKVILDRCGSWWQPKYLECNQDILALAEWRSRILCPLRNDSSWKHVMVRCHGCLLFKMPPPPAENVCKNWQHGYIVQSMPCIWG